MRKAHRRIHVVTWLILAPLTLAVAIMALHAAPKNPKTNLPDVLTEAR